MSSESVANGHSSKISELSWETTFYYGQELRSVYVNNLLSGIVTPGVYNADMYLITKSGISGEAGIYLKIKKGTTFVFSNKYIKGKVDEKYHRDLSSFGSYVVKCIAVKDIEVVVCRIGQDTKSKFVFSKKNNVFRDKIYYIYAYLNYNGDPAVTSEADDTTNGTTYQQEPMFNICFPEAALEDVKDSNDVGTAIDNLRFPEFQPGFSPDTYSYLLLGAVIDTQLYQLSSGEGYANSGSWNTGNSISGNQAWLNNHIFTGRSLPDYHGSLSSGNTNNNYPYLKTSANCNAFYLSPSSYLYKSNLLSLDDSGFEIATDVNGEDSSEEGQKPLTNPVTYNQSKENPSTPWYVLDSYSQDALLSKDNVDKNLYKLINGYKKDNNNKLTNKAFIEKASDDEKTLLVTALFLSTDSKHSNPSKNSGGSYPEEDISNLFWKVDASHKNDYTIKPEIVSYTDWFIAPKNLDVPSLYSYNDSIPLRDPFNPQNIGGLYNDETYTGGIIPLDVSRSNINRLKSIIKNRNILLPIINHMRLHPEKVVVGFNFDQKNFQRKDLRYFDGSVATDLIPLALIFRNFYVPGKTDDSITHPYKEDSKNLKFLLDKPSELQPGASKWCKVFDDTATTFQARWDENTYYDVVNPANILCYSDLVNIKSIPAVDIAAEDIFPVLPFLNYSGQAGEATTNAAD